VTHGEKERKRVTSSKKTATSSEKEQLPAKKQLSAKSGDFRQKVATFGEKRRLPAKFHCLFLLFQSIC